jgi:hypothetical protein
VITSDILGKHGRIFNQKENWGRAHICEFHRRIYDELILSGNNELATKIIPLLEEAYLLGIRMQNKLVKYKLEQVDPITEPIEDTGKALERRKERKRLEELLAWGENEVSKSVG